MIEFKLMSYYSVDAIQVYRIGKDLLIENKLNSRKVTRLSKIQRKYFSKNFKISIVFNCIFFITTILNIN